jgi:hypothetical protein
MRLPVVCLLIALAFSVLAATYRVESGRTAAGEECAGARRLSGNPPCNCQGDRRTPGPVQAPILFSEDVSVRGY